MLVDIFYDAVYYLHAIWVGLQIFMFDLIIFGLYFGIAYLLTYMPPGLMGFFINPAVWIYTLWIIHAIHRHKFAIIDWAWQWGWPDHFYGLW